MVRDLLSVGLKTGVSAGTHLKTICRKVNISLYMLFVSERKGDLTRSLDVSKINEKRSII